MKRQPTSVHEHPTISGVDVEPSCPFCAITSVYQPISPLSAPGNSLLDPERVDRPAFVLLSTEHVVAFLDIFPLTRGHVLVAPRKHRVKVGQLSADESAEIGRLLPLLARAVTRSVLPDIPHEEVDYNIVQNNGPGAAQVVPHVHYHIVPRPPIGYQLPPPVRKYPANEVPTGIRRTMTLFGRGQREERDDEDALVLIDEMRKCVKDEWEKAVKNGDIGRDWIGRTKI